ncbi:alpha/beta hydrolase [Nocardia aobensis]|uniref:Alpha/beta hydrolase n=1 Tax=Nocardia aobensis TaxID=257277 RepID=A0ABW6NWI3_9NOCA
MPYFQGARGRLHYRRWPVERPVALVAFLPGTGQHSGHYHRLGRGLGAHGIELWCLDTAGQGLSEGDPAAPGTLPELAGDAAALVRVLRAERPDPLLFLAGHSLGAATCLASMSLPEMSGCAGMVLTGTPKRAVESPAALPPGLPMLALHGVDDRRAPIDSARAWAARHPSVGLHEYTDAGHDLLHEPVHAAVTADIAEWIREVADRRHGAAEVG